MFAEPDILPIICFLIIVFVVIKYLDTYKNIKKLERNDNILYKKIQALDNTINNLNQIHPNVPSDPGPSNPGPSNSGSNHGSDSVGKFLFILFYAPWCGHSKNFLPVWQELEEKLKDHPKVQILTIDCTTPEGEAICKKAQIPGYPMMKLRKPNGDLVEYEGGRTLPDLANFLNEHVN